MQFYWKVHKEFEIKNLGEYHDLYFQKDILLLADVVENSSNKCIETCELDPAHFLSAPFISMASLFKKDRNKIRIINRH